MKKTLVTSVILAAGLSCAGLSSAATVNMLGKVWYTGVGLNLNATRNQDLYYPVFNSTIPSPRMEYTLDSSQIGWNLFLGKQITRHIALEGGFTYLGDETYRGKHSTNNPPSENAGCIAKLFARNVYNLYIDGILSLPVWKENVHSISAFVKGGTVYMHARNMIEACPHVGAPSDGQLQKHSWTLDSFGVDYGFGVQYKYKDYGVRLSYNDYLYRESTEISHIIPSTVNLDLIWQF